MKAHPRTRQGASSAHPGEPDGLAVQGNSADGPRSRRTRRSDPTRMQGALVISDGTWQALERCELFRKLDRQPLMAVAALVEEDSIAASDTLIAEGESAKQLYVVVEGRGVAQVELERGWLSLGLVGPTDAAGWSSLIEGQVYPASVKALTPMRVARIEASGLILLMNLEPRIGYLIHKSLRACVKSGFK
jgi:hypothetical protein